MRLRTTTSVLLVAAAGLLAGCGSDDEEGAGIPVAAADQLQSRLVEVRNRFEFGGGACADIANDSQPAVEEIIQSLPADVDQDVRDALRQGFDRLFELSAEQCQGEEETQTDTEPEPPPETETTPTETTPTETTPPETTPPETTPQEPTEPAPPEEPGPGEGDDGSGGGGAPGDDG